jgi:hypothetical protein
MPAGTALRPGFGQRHFTKRQGSATERTAFQQRATLSQIEAAENPKTAQSAARFSLFSLGFASSCFASAKRMRHSVMGPAALGGWPRSGQRIKAAGKSRRSCGPALFRRSPNHGSIHNMVAALARSARMPNPSVKGDAQQRATSSAWGAPHLTPSSRRATLSVAPYLKRYGAARAA